MGGGRECMKAICDRFGVEFVDTPDDAIVSVADNVEPDAYPLNGLRYRRGTTSGWFIWTGLEMGAEDDFFKPTHARHLENRCRDGLAMLGLPEGSRFVIAPAYEDVWFDQQLLDVSV